MVPLCYLRFHQTMARHFTLPATANTNDYAVSVRTRHRVVARGEGCCAYCGVRGVDELQVDHVTPASHFAQGTPREIVSAPSNLVPACESCNLSKGGCDLLGWASKLLTLGVKPAVVTEMMHRVRMQTAEPLP